MTIHLPEELARYVHDQVQAGRFLSEDDVITDALYRQRQAVETAPAASAANAAPPKPIWEVFEEISASIPEEEWAKLPAAASERHPPADSLDQRPIWEVIDELRESVPAEEWEKLPTDSSRQLKHYLYGVPKRPNP